MPFGEPAVKQQNVILKSSYLQTSSVARKLANAHVWIVQGVLCTLLIVGAGTAAADEEARVLGTVTTLFDAMRAKDRDALRNAFLPEGRLGTDSTEGWISSVSSSQAYLDEVTFDELVLIDDTMAMAWTPYNLFVNNEFHHCGVDVFTLRKIEDQWKILQIDDTRRTEDCDPERRGN